MSVSEAQSWAQIALAGTETGTVILGRERFSIRLRFAKDVRQSPESIKNLRVDTPQGARVPLHELAKVAFRLGPQAIKSAVKRRRLSILSMRLVQKNIGKCSFTKAWLRAEIKKNSTV